MPLNSVDDAQTLTCHAAREGLSAVVPSGMDLTAQALAHAHLMQCPECRRERERLQQLASSRPPVAPSLTVGLVRLRAVPATALTVLERSGRSVGAGARAAATLPVRALAGAGRELRTLLAAPGRAGARLIGHVGMATTRAAALLVSLGSSAVIACREGMRAALAGAGAGVAAVMDLLVGMGRLIPALVAWLGRAAATVGRRVAAGLTWVAAATRDLGSEAMGAARDLARAVGEAARAGVARSLWGLSRLRAALSLVLAGSGRAAVFVLASIRAGVAGTIGLLAALGRLVPALVPPARQAAASMGGRAAAGLARVADAMGVLESVSMVAARSVARAVGEAACAGVTGARSGITRVTATAEGLGSASMVAARSVARVVGEAARAGVTGVRAGITRAADATRSLGSSLMVASRRAARAAGQVVRAGVTRLLATRTRLDAWRSIALAASGRAVSDVVAASRAVSIARPRAFRRAPRLAGRWLVGPVLKISAGIASVAGVAVAVALLSTGPQLPRDVRLPAEEPPALADSSKPTLVSVPEPVRVEVPRPEIGGVVMRPQPSDPAVVRSRAPAPAPPTRSAETIQNADAPDPAAAIDWLLQGSRGRRQPEGP